MTTHYVAIHIGGEDEYHDPSKLSPGAASYDDVIPIEEALAMGYEPCEKCYGEAYR